MRRNPEQVAWSVLLSAFFICCALSTSLPLAGRWWLRNAAQDQNILLTNTSPGTVLVTRPGRSVPEANLFNIPVGSTIVTNPDAQASLTFTAPNDHTELATLQIYGNTQLIITHANSPRYPTGAHPHSIQIQLIAGRIRAVIGVIKVSRPVEVLLSSQSGALIRLNRPGSNVSLEATFAQTTVSVREGEAAVVAQNQTLQLQKDQRAEVQVNLPPNGPLPAERNLIVNGDFNNPLETGWVLDIRPPYDPSEDPGSVKVITSGGQRAIQIKRIGRNWGKAGITQEINQDVRDFKTLTLHLRVLVAQQDVWNCGELGTECPIMIQIKYVDVGGGEREWLQGYYNNPNAIFGKTFCASCTGPRSEHQRVFPNQWQTIDTANLLESFRAANMSAVILKSISIYGEGHSFESLVTEVQLLGVE